MDSPADLPAPEGPVTTYVYDADNRLKFVQERMKDETVSAYFYEPTPDQFTFEHDKQKRLFLLTGKDGKVERFRDNPVRQLVVEPDPETGEMRPVTVLGKPTYIYLCREDRES